MHVNKSDKQVEIQASRKLLQLDNLIYEKWIGIKM